MKIEENWHWNDAVSRVLILIPRTYIRMYYVGCSKDRHGPATRWLVVNLPHQQTIQKSLWNLPVDFAFPLLHSHVGRSFYRHLFTIQIFVVSLSVCMCMREISSRNRKRELLSIESFRFKNWNLTAPFLHWLISRLLKHCLSLSLFLFLFFLL